MVGMFNNIVCIYVYIILFIYLFGQEIMLRDETLQNNHIITMTDVVDDMKISLLLY